MKLAVINPSGWVWDEELQRQSPLDVGEHQTATVLSNIGALIIRIGFWDKLYHTNNKELPT